VGRVWLPLLRLVSFRHLLQAPLRTALTLIGVAVGVATMVGATAINRTVLEAFRSTVDTIAGKADLTVAGTQVGFPDEVLEQVRGVPGVLVGGARVPHGGVSPDAQAASGGLSGGLIGVLAGTVLGLIVTFIVSEQSTGWSSPYLFPTGVALQKSLTATLCAAVAGLYPARSAASLDVVEALAYE
jgi:ABC-type antimicrobial peptide transport system permease subunit